MKLVTAPYAKMPKDRDVRTEICDTLARFIAQRPGLTPDYFADFRAYRASARKLQKDRHEAERLLAAVRADNSITAEDILAAAEGGRLVINPNTRCVVYPHARFPEEETRVSIDYHEGQMGQLEFRAAAANLLATLLRRALNKKNKDTLPPGGDWGTPARAHFRKVFGASMQKRWFS